MMMKMRMRQMRVSLTLGIIQGGSFQASFQHRLIISNRRKRDKILPTTRLGSRSISNSNSILVAPNLKGRIGDLISNNNSNNLEGNRIIRV